VGVFGVCGFDVGGGPCLVCMGLVFPCVFVAMGERGPSLSTHLGGNREGKEDTTA